MRTWNITLRNVVTNGKSQWTWRAEMCGAWTHGEPSMVFDSIEAAARSAAAWVDGAETFGVTTMTESK